MHYPDGTAVSLCDHIWWNEGSCLGFIHEIVEDLIDQKTWGFYEPHILLSGFHPPDPGGPGYVAYPRSDFDDEGIARLTPEEEDDFAHALDTVKSSAGFKEPFHVKFDILTPAKGEWVFEIFENGEFREFARVKSIRPQAE